jgi:hypothetical protein
MSTTENLRIEIGANFAVSIWILDPSNRARESSGRREGWNRASWARGGLEFSKGMPKQSARPRWGHSSTFDLSSASI